MRRKTRCKFHVPSTRLFIVLLLFVIGLCASWADHHMSATHRNKEIARRGWEAVNERNLDIVDEVYSLNLVYHSDPSIKGAEGIKQLITLYTTAFPDMVITVED